MNAKKNIPKTPKPTMPPLRPMQRDVVEIASRLRVHRRKRGYSQTKLAEISGVSESMIFYVESHRAVPTLDTLIKLCKALKISPGSLFPGRK